MAAACYLGKQRVIDKANGAWQAILNEFGPEATFHATAFFFSWKSFRDWHPKGERHAQFAEGCR